jgi:nicotinate-nucleotide adenylyltransferase
MIPFSLMDSTGPGEPDTPRLDIIVRASGGLSEAKGRLGVLGSAYNPITHAHLALARTAVEHFDLDEVVFVLSESPPQKPIYGASLEQRLEMMRLGTVDVPYISIGFCTHGLFLDISTALQRAYDQKPELYFITGRDAAERILTWPYKDPTDALAQMFLSFQLLVFDRHGQFKLPENPLIQQYAGRIHPLRLPEHIDKVSSTKVRRRVYLGVSINELVPAKVAAFIVDHDLYKSVPEE